MTHIYQGEISTTLRIKKNDEEIQCLLIKRTLWRVGEFDLLVDALERNTVVTTLDLTGSRCTTENLRMIYRLLVRNATNITCFVPPPGRIDAHFLFSCLSTNSTLWELVLIRTSMDIQEIKLLADVLTHNTTLGILYLVDNLLTSDGFKYLSDMLKVNKTLVELRFEYNYANDECAYHIADALKTNNTLKTLLFGPNSFRNKGVISLISALKTNVGIEELSLVGAFINGECCIQLSEMFQCNSTLKRLRINFLEPPNEEQRRLVEDALKMNFSIVKFEATTTIELKSILSESATQHVKTNRHNERMRNQTLLSALWSVATKEA
jgi:hypothetical protein